MLNTMFDPSKNVCTFAVVAIGLAQLVKEVIAAVQP